MKKFFTLVFLVFAYKTVYAFDLKGMLGIEDVPPQPAISYEIIISDSYAKDHLAYQEKARSLINNLITELRANDALNIYDSSFQLITKIEMPGEELSSKLKTKKFISNMRDINENLISLGAKNKGNDKFIMIKLSDFLERRKQEENSRHLEVILFSSISHPDLDKIFDENKETKDAAFLFVTDNSRLDIRAKRKALENIRIHIYHPELKNDFSQKNLCGFWSTYFHLQSAQIISCQSQDIIDRVGNASASPIQISSTNIEEIDKLSQSALKLTQDQNKIIEEINSPEVDETKVALKKSNDLPGSVQEKSKEAGNNDINISIHLPQNQSNLNNDNTNITTGYSWQYLVEATWDNPATDVDLIAQVGNEKIYYNKDTDFGRHTKSKKSGFERIELNKLHDDTKIRIENSRGEPPKNIKLIIKDQFGNIIKELSPNTFESYVTKNGKKEFIEYNLNSLIKDGSIHGVSN